MRDSIDEWTAVLLRAAFHRPRNADELGFDRVVCDSHRGVTVAAHVEKRQVRRQVRIRQAPGGLDVACLLILEARAHTVMPQQIDSGLRLTLSRAVGYIQRTQRMVLGKAVLVRFDRGACIAS